MVAPLQAVAERVRKLQSAGNKVVFTNGCFDLIHPGHISLLSQAAAQCDRLIVGTGTGALPVMDEVKREAQRRKITLIVVPTDRAIDILDQEPAETNAILHVTC